MKKHVFNTCSICGVEKTPRGISQHIKKAHGMTLDQYIVNYFYNGVHPKCQCGCGSDVTIRGYCVMDYVDGHSPAGQFKVGETPKRDYEKWKHNVTKAIRIYNHTAKQQDPNYRSGANNNFFGRSHSEETKEKIRQSVERQITSGKHAFIGNNNGRIGRSSLEIKFEKYLTDIGVLFDQGYKVSFIKDHCMVPRNKYYDFYIPSINTLVEIHGSYWHPQKTDGISTMQQNNLINDRFKKQLAKKNLFNLLTIYDYELDSFILNDGLQDILDYFKNDQVDLSFSGYAKSTVIELPDYWPSLVDGDSVTVQLTAVGNAQANLCVLTVSADRIHIHNPHNTEYFYFVQAERKDTDKLVVEIDCTTEEQ